MTLSERVQAWLELLRPPNLATMASNAVLGVWLGTLTQGRLPGVPGSTWTFDAAHAFAFDGGDLATLARVAGGLCAFYLVGLILNDVFDLKIDRRERPQRPLPSGRVRVVHAAFAAMALWLVGLWSIGALRGPDGTVDLPLLAFCLLLTAMIVAYNLLHTRSKSAVVLPALCRGLAIVLAAVATLPDSADAWRTWRTIEWAIVLVPAAATALFVLSVSVLARREVAVDPARRCAGCGQRLLDAAERCSECDRATPPTTGRIVRVGELGRDPWWVVASGLPCLLPAIGFGALLPQMLAASVAADQMARDGATLVAFVVWLWTATRWSAETPVPRLVGRWLGSLCLLDAVMLAPFGPAPTLLCLALHGGGRVLAKRFAGS